jgi:hypothetical protein
LGLKIAKPCLESFKTESFEFIEYRQHLREIRRVNSPGVRLTTDSDTPARPCGHTRTGGSRDAAQRQSGQKFATRDQHSILLFWSN